MKINQLLDEIDLPKRYFSEAFIIGEKFEEEASKYLILLTIVMSVILMPIKKLNLMKN